MNREAIKDQLEALMDEATPKKPVKEAIPKAGPNKTLMATLIVGGTILGALLMGIFHPDPVPSSAASDVKETVTVPNKPPEGDSVLFYVGFGRIRK